MSLNNYPFNLLRIYEESTFVVPIIGPNPATGFMLGVGGQYAFKMPGSSMYSARGYTQGRYRGNNLVYGESEYRFPISKYTGILGGVVFVNTTTTNNTAQSLKLFQSVRPGYGFGLRIMADKRSRTNLAIDYGFGNKSSGFYLAASEVF